ncbi:MAG: S8 family serine peptidase [Rubrobacteraceae bacterium]
MKFPTAALTIRLRRSANYTWCLLAGVVLVALLVVSSGVGLAQENSAAAVPEQPSFAIPEDPGQEFVPGRLLVKARNGESSDNIEQANQRLGANTEEEFPELDAKLVEFDPSRPVEKVADAYEQDPNVEYAEPDFIRHPGTVIPNDPWFPEQWNLHNTGGTLGVTAGTVDADVDAPEAWSITKGAASNVVAVVDTGVNVKHPDLEGNISKIPGWDFYHNDASVYDENDEDLHGTHVAGIVAATADNGRGVSGVAPEARVLPLKVCGPTGCPSSAIIDAFGYAASKGVKIVNASLGGGQFSQAERDAIEAAKGDGVLFVFPAGNGGQDLVGDDNDVSPFYPASYDNDNTISVAASDPRDDLADFSNYGESSVDLASPGVDVLSTVPGTYETMSGTSVAAPQVAGVAALLLSRAPSLGTDAAKTTILDTAEKKPSFDGKSVTGGRLNAASALEAVHTRLTLKASRRLISYNGKTLLAGKLKSASAILKDKRIEVWRSGDGGRRWKKDGIASYDSAANNYAATRKLTANTTFQFRFAGAPSHGFATSPKVTVRARAYLSRPKMSSKVKKGSAFRVSGYLKPRHSGTTRLDFYQFKNSKWRLQKSAKAGNMPYKSYTRYTGLYKLSSPGRWKVRARHADSNHAATMSRQKYFRVRR